MSNSEHHFQHICNNSLGISYIHRICSDHILPLLPQFLTNSTCLFFPGGYTFQFALLCRATSPHLHENSLLLSLTESSLYYPYPHGCEHNHCSVFGRPGAITLKNLIILPLEDKQSWELMSAAILSWQEYTMYLHFSCLPYSPSLAVNA